MPGNKKYAGLIEQLYREKKESIEAADKLITADLRTSTGEDSLVDNHPADIATEVYERGRDMAIRDRLKHKVEAIDAALERLKKGKYGICEHCGREIPFERLKAIPYTTDCAECSREKEKEEQHSFDRGSPEEEILSRAFSRTFNDSTDRAGFDGEDSWQAVARYGSSESPQDLGTNRNVSDPNDFYEDADEQIGAVEDIETIEAVVDPEFGNTIYYDNKHGRRRYEREKEL